MSNETVFENPLKNCTTFHLDGENELCNQNRIFHLGFIVVIFLLVSLNHYLTYSRAEHNRAKAQTELAYQIQVDQLQLLEFALLNQEDPFLSEHWFYKEINTCHEDETQ